MKRSRTIGAYVVHLVVAALLLLRSARNEQLAIATAADERAQAAAADLDRELRNLQDLLAILASLHSPFTTDLNVNSPADTALLKDRVLGLIARDLSGKPFFNTCNGKGRTIPVSKALADRLDLPIGRGNKPEYILSLCAPPRVFQILTEHNLPDGWTALVINRQGRIIARTPGSVETSSATARTGAVSVAVFWSKILGGDVVDSLSSAYKVTSSVDRAGWIVTISVPNKTFFGPILRSFLLLTAGGGTAALVIVLAIDIGQRIASPITNLTGNVRALGNGARVAPRFRRFASYRNSA